MSTQDIPAVAPAVAEGQRWRNSKGDIFEVLGMYQGKGRAGNQVLVAKVMSNGALATRTSWEKMAAFNNGRMGFSYQAEDQPK